MSTLRCTVCPTGEIWLAMWGIGGPDGSEGSWWQGGHAGTYKSGGYVRRECPPHNHAMPQWGHAEPHDLRIQTGGVEGGTNPFTTPYYYIVGNTDSVTEILRLRCRT